MNSEDLPENICPHCGGIMKEYPLFDQDEDETLLISQCEDCGYEE